MAKEIKKYLHKKAINIPLYTGKLVLIISNDIEKVQNKYDILLFADFIYAHATKVNENGKTGYAIILNFDYTISLTHGDIAHEALHIAIDIAEHHNVETDAQEPMAYIVGWVVDEVYKFIEKHDFYKRLKFR